MELSVSGTPPWKVIRQLKGGENNLLVRRLPSIFSGMGLKKEVTVHSTLLTLPTDLRPDIPTQTADNCCLFFLLLLAQAVPEEMVRFLLLVVGVALVQLDDGAGGKSGSSNEGEDKVRGLLAIGAASVTSGVAGVLKGMKKDTLWTKNVSLALPSIAFAASPLLGSPTSLSLENFFLGMLPRPTVLEITLTPMIAYTPLVWGVILLQSLGGILVSLVVRDFSSVTKGFVTSGSIILTSSGGMYL
ncbi:hypothetical protein BT69DRAFT_1337992 [Atractiella rhizophila]|nr:hypothetical protein BT69DRAFT_1337992 [Atractiella rhizophila]